MSPDVAAARSDEHRPPKPKDEGSSPSRNAGRLLWRVSLTGKAPVSKTGVAPSLGGSSPSPSVLALGQNRAVEQENSRAVENPSRSTAVYCSPVLPLMMDQQNPEGWQSG